MDVEFDSVKDAIDRDKHGVSLAFGARIVDHPVAIELPSSREIDGEFFAMRRWHRSMTGSGPLSSSGEERRSGSLR